jgi:prepilin-type N-terminal cleavage/methylation domain-containing protein
MKKNKGGFTLIELLVVVAIIGILSAIVLASLGPVRARARNAERLSQLKEISKALEFYYSDYNQYPVYAIGAGNCDTSLGEIDCNSPPASGDWDNNIGGLHDLENEDYLTVMPKDPINNNNNYYQYEVCVANGQTYVLKTVLENPASTFVVGEGKNVNLLRADSNANGIMDIFDLAAIVNCIGQPVEGVCGFKDIDGNGAIEAADVLLAQQYLGSC